MYYRSKVYDDLLYPNYYKTLDALHNFSGKILREVF